MKISNVWLQSQEAAALCQRAEIITVTASPDTPSSLLIFCFHYTPAKTRCRGFVNSVFGAREKLSTFVYRTAIFNLPSHTLGCLFALVPIIIVTVADESVLAHSGGSTSNGLVSVAA